ncbi:transcription initiation factor IIF, alpha subunit (TFIIF-alpha) domain-containing protein [Phthorimaea operculella]|nr:transcription initiation factor IIF, alpha subunit (TFIIF-alpha) domain-containing protein [Phthorimaea operculella]
MTTPGSSGSQAATVQEFKIRVPKNVKKKYHVMRFNATLNVDFAKWTQVKMERENNIKEFKGIDEDMPKFGAGSEYGRDVREEARRKKFGIIARKYKPEDQPWILKVGGKTGKKFKGIREGGVSENAAYYVFTHAADGAIDAYPLQEWYNFQPIQRYKALSAEEAEQEFGRRNKVMNFFSLMFRKRMRGDEAADDDDPDEKKTKGGKAKKDLKISDMDEWIDSEDDSDDDSDAEKKDKDEDSDSGAKKKKDKKKAGAAAKKKKKVEDEAFEDSDDGDEEGREKDYISDSSESESDHENKANKDLKGVAEEDALRKLLTSDEDSEEEQEQKQEDEDQEDEPTKEGEERASKLKPKKKKQDEVKKESSSEFSSDSDTDPESSSAPKKPKKSKDKNKDKEVPAASSSAGASAPGSASTSRSGTPTPASNAANAVAAANAAANQPPPKRAKLDSSYSECGVTEEAVRRYLARKPMTTTELLTKFKSKRTGVSSERLVETMTQILKRINPVKQNINGKMYLSIKH